MNSHEQANHRAVPPFALQRALPNLRALLRTIPRPRWAAPALIGLGVASSLAEMAGIMLIPLFFYSMMNQLGSLAASGGLLGDALRYAITRFSSSREIALVFLALIVLRGVLAYFYTIITSQVSESISKETRERLHKIYLQVPYGFVQGHEQADLVQTLGHEVNLVAKAYTSLTRIFINLTFIALLSVLLAVISWQITVWVILGSLLLSSVLRFLSARATTIGKDVRRIHRDLWDVMITTLQGLRVIRVFAQESACQKRFESASAEARDVVVRELQLLLLLDPLTEVGYLVILIVIILSAQSFGISFATTLTCVALLYRLQPHVRELEGHRLALLSLEPQLASVLSFFAAADRHTPPLRLRPVDDLRERIRFRNVSFRYGEDAPLALDNVTFEIPAGRTTAIVGASGSGKTTIVNLLLDLYHPLSGDILIDEVPLHQIRRDDWLSIVAIAGQDAELIDGSVLDNVRLADPSASEPAVAAAARMMGIASVIESLPEAYQTWVGHQGLRFSGGQRQRIGLARAALHQPRILILDEALNAMDDELEQQIRESIRHHYQGCTVLLVTHHLESALRSDHVIRLEEGRIVAEGTPEQVLAHTRAGQAHGTVCD